MTETQDPAERGGYADVESDEANVDAGGKAHTSSTEEHPAGDGERTDRDVGGPKTDQT